MKLSGIADFVISFFELVEAEGRALRRGVMRLGWGIALMLLAVVLLFVAAGFFLVGIYLYVSAHFSPVPAALLVSCIAVLLSLVIAGIAYERTR